MGEEDEDDDEIDADESVNLSNIIENDKEMEDVNVDVDVNVVNVDVNPLWWRSSTGSAWEENVSSASGSERSPPVMSDGKSNINETYPKIKSFPKHLTAVSEEASDLKLNLSASQVKWCDSKSVWFQVTGLDFSPRLSPRALSPKTELEKELVEHRQRESLRVWEL